MTEAVISVKPKKTGTTLHKLRTREQITGYLFVLPALIVILVFGLFPIGYSIYMSLFNWRVTKGAYVGGKNYLLIFGNWTNLLITLAGIALIVGAFWIWNNAFKSLSKGQTIAKVVAAVIMILGGVIFITGWGYMYDSGNQNFLNSLIVTLYYALGTVPAEVILGMILAFLLYQDIIGKDIFRMIYFLPYVTPSVTSAVVFQIIFSLRETSIANMIIGWFGISPQKWRFEPKPLLNLLGLDLSGFLAGPSLALISIMIYGIWSFVGYNTVIFLAGLGNIPKETYEAAEIDGATRSQQFRFITMPLLSPTTFYLVLIGFIGTFKAFNHIYVLRTPSAGDSVITTSLLIFDNFYKANQYGIATAQAIVLFVVILGLTLAQNKLIGERVFYG
ncbi:MAG: ABC transporter permease subunit [Anaerolineaceae bacterium]|nr:ABC transporter permease subunit [Anaerolineaceae bacterium]MDD4042061.1 ABC transporter permease subunit [Anaerolineaceae bacterium]MDD4578852.1 ABC transporter permease subunit [Anaerolineaceae bacterium]